MHCRVKLGNDGCKYASLRFGLVVNFGDQCDVKTGHLLEGRRRALSVLAVFVFQSVCAPSKANTSKPREHSQTSI